MTLVARLVARGLVGRGRLVALVALSLFPVVGAVAARSAGADDRVVAVILERAHLSVVVALVVLVIGGSALGDLRDSGAITHLATAPLARRTIVVGAVLGTCAVAVPLLTVTGVVSAALATGDAEVVARTAAATVLAVAAYAAIGVLLSVASRHPLIVGVLYAVIWETSIAGFAPSAPRFSVSAYARRIVADGLDTRALNPPPGVETVGAIVVLAVVAAVLTLYAARRLTRANLP